MPNRSRIGLTLFLARVQFSLPDCVIHQRDKSLGFLYGCRGFDLGSIDLEYASYWPSTEGIGASKAFITSSTGTCDEDRSRIRTGYGPENISRLRRFAVGILKSFQKRTQSISEMMRKLCFRTRLVFDYLRMTQTSSAGGFAH